MDLAQAAREPVPSVLAAFGVGPAGLTTAEAGRRLAEHGPNAVRHGGVSGLRVLRRQVKSPLVALLFAAAVVAFAVRERSEGAIIGVILAASIGLGFFNEYRSERAVDSLHSAIRHSATVIRDGRQQRVDVTMVVPGDMVVIGLGHVVPADMRIIEADGLECGEAVVTGESAPASKTEVAAPAGEGPLDLPSCAFMGTVVRAGRGRGVAVATGRHTVIGGIAVGLGEQHAQTDFQVGLAQFSKMLFMVTGLLAGGIFAINLAFGRPLLESGLFALAIAVGLTPQLLPAIVTISLSTGARELARVKVVVKRLVAIEDLGNIEVLFTDKTGTLTEGAIGFLRAEPMGDQSPEAVLRLGVICTTDGPPNALDAALLAASPRPALPRLVELAFDHDRRIMSVVTEDGGVRRLVTKGAPEAVLARCRNVPAAAADVLTREFGQGHRVVAVATKDLGPAAAPVEDNLELAGFLMLSDPPKAGVAQSLARLQALGIEVKIVTGDNDVVARTVCSELGMAVNRVVTGTELAEMTDPQLATALPDVTIFARVSPEQKSRIIKTQRALGRDVAFLGDGVNDAVALHDADVGISVEDASEVARDAADVVMMTKDLDTLANGVVEGRRIFTNTVKYVLMGTSSNFGNMFSAAGASLFLDFLPMLPTQILLNNLLYDCSEMTIPSDAVDPEALLRPAHWDIGFIRRFMLVFGPISSLYDFLTFGVMLWVLHAGAVEFRSGWFVESLLSQSLVIFVIRTQRVPFFRSRPSRPLLLATISVAVVGVLIPFSPISASLGFTRLPLPFLAALVAMVATYLVLVETGKALFFRHVRPVGGARRAAEVRRLHRRVGRFHAEPDSAKRPSGGAPVTSGPSPNMAGEPRWTRKSLEVRS